MPHLWGEAETHNRGEKSQELVLCSRHKATSPELSEHFFRDKYKKNVLACSMWQKPLQYFFDLDFVPSTLRSDCFSPSATGWDSQIIITKMSTSESALWQAIRQKQHKGERLASEISVCSPGLHWLWQKLPTSRQTGSK